MTHQGKPVNIIYLELPARIHGILQETAAEFLIAINAADAPIVQRHALGHELCHIYRNHLNQPERGLKDIEQEANKYAWQYYRSYKNNRTGATYENYSDS